MPFKSVLQQSGKQSQAAVVPPHVQMSFAVARQRYPSVTSNLDHYVMMMVQGVQE